MSSSENVGCLGLLLRFFGSKASNAAAAESFPYRVRDDFVSAAELSFYHTLAQIVSGRAKVCPKVNLSDIFFVSQPHENRSARGQISQKHVDFLVCDPRTMKPLFGVELDDASHTRPDRQARDEFVEKVFDAAGLPLLRVPVQRAYRVQEIAVQIEPLLRVRSLPAEAATPTLSNDSAPPCPKCGIEMVKRTAARGERSGQAFYGCPNYPKCRETLAITT